jgi:hypothetical protein
MTGVSVAALVARLELLEHLLHASRVVRHRQREHQENASFLRVEVVAEKTDISRVFGDIATAGSRGADHDDSFIYSLPDRRQREKRFATRADARYDDAASAVSHRSVIHVPPVVLVPIDDVDLRQRIQLRDVERSLRCLQLGYSCFEVRHLINQRADKAIVRTLERVERVRVRLRRISSRADAVVEDN